MLKPQELRVYAGSTEIIVPLSTYPTEQQEIVRALRDTFVSSLTLQESFAPSNDDDPEARDRAVAQFEVQLLARFLSFLSTKCAHDDNHGVFKREICVTLLKDVLDRFNKLHLVDKDVHSLVAPYDPKSRQDVLSSYYTACGTLETNGELPILKPRQPDLLSEVKEGSASLYAIFGGQGPNKIYFDELRYLFDTYRHFVEAFIDTISRDVLQPLAQEHVSSTFYPFGLDVLSWMTGVTPRPDVSYFIPVPISFPLIGLVQFTQFLVAARVSGISLASFRAKFAGVSGLSQGVAVAASIASIVFGPSRSSQSPLSIQPSFKLQASLDGEHGTPSPMLTVIGLPAEKLSLHVASANEKSTPDSQIMVSLHNCPDVFVITGRPEALYTFLTRMKPVEGVRLMRFLQISAPFHNPSLQCVAEQVCAEDLTNEEVWTVSELQMAVYNTEDGSDLRECSGSLTQSISDQIFTHPLHWIRATNWPASATHAVDFGPGGANGAGAIAARNFHGQGRSVLFTCIGDRGEGDTELYSAKKLMLETLDV